MTSDNETNIEQFPGAAEDTGPTPLEVFNNAIVQASLAANAAGVPLWAMARVSNLVFLGAFADILKTTPDDRVAFAGVVTCGQAANTLLQIGQ